MSIKKALTGSYTRVIISCHQACFHFVNGNYCKFHIDHKKFYQACKPKFLQIFHEDQSLKFWLRIIHTFFDICRKHVNFMLLYCSRCCQQVQNNFVNSDLLLIKLSGIDLSKKIIYILFGHGWHNFFMVCSKLVAMGIYETKTGLKDWYNSMSIASETSLKVVPKWNVGHALFSHKWESIYSFCFPLFIFYAAAYQTMHWIVSLMNHKQFSQKWSLVITHAQTWQLILTYSYLVNN